MERVIIENRREEKNGGNMHTSHRKPTTQWQAIWLLLIMLLLAAACEPLEPASNGLTRPALETASAPQAYPNPTRPIPEDPTRDPSLYAWQGMSLRLDTSLPDTPGLAAVYLVQPYQHATKGSAQALAERFSIQGEAYPSSFSLRENAVTYLVTTGGPRLYISADYDFAYYTQYGRENDGRDISDEQAHAAIDDFITTHGFDFEYQIERTAQDQAGFYAAQLLDGKPLLYQPFHPGGLYFELDSQGQIFSVTGALHPFDAVGQFPIRSAREAFQFTLEWRGAGSLAANRAGTQSDYQIWYRAYPDEQSIALYSQVEVVTPSLLTLDGYSLSGHIAGLSNVNSGQMIVAHGRFRLVDGIRRFVVDDWKVSGAKIARHMGYLSFDGGQWMFHDKQQGRHFVVRDLPPNIPEPRYMTEQPFIINGVLLADGTFEWKTLQNPQDGPHIPKSRISPMGGISLFKLNLDGPPIPLPTPFPTPVPLSTTAAGKLLYTIQPGDTYASIAEKFNVSLQALMDANGISDLVMLSVDTSLVIPDTKGLQTFQALRGIVTINLFPQTDGKQRVEYHFQPDDPRYVHTLMILEGGGLENLHNYHNRPVDIWGRLDHVNSNGNWIVQVESHQIPFPDLGFQLLSGVQKLIHEDENENLYLFDTENGDTYILLNPDGTPITSGYDRARLRVEALAIPDETYNGFTALHVFQVLNGDPSEHEITADRPNTWKEQRTPAFRPDITINQVDLVYLLTDARIEGLTSPEGPVYVQPMWRFSGYNQRGNRIEILVQALKDEFLSPEIQVIGGP